MQRPACGVITDGCNHREKVLIPMEDVKASRQNTAAV